VTGMHGMAAHGRRNADATGVRRWSVLAWAPLRAAPPIG
jgi:hypothetical protein